MKKSDIGFSHNYGRSARPRRRWLPQGFCRNAAAAIAAGVASFTALSAGVAAGTQPYDNPAAAGQGTETLTATGWIALLPDTIASVEGNRDPAPEIVVFDNETLAAIIARIADFYDYKFVFGTDASESLRLYFRWDPALPVDEVAERLNNFGRIHLTLKDATIIVD